jgi:hypothetical protein
VIRSSPSPAIRRSPRRLSPAAFARSIVGGRVGSLQSVSVS